MKFKQLLTKSLLAAVGLLVGASASWADPTVLNPTGTAQLNLAENSTSATSWRCSQAAVRSTPANYVGTFTTNTVVITKFDASSTLSGKTLTKAELKFHSVCTASGKNSTLWAAVLKNVSWAVTDVSNGNINVKDLADYGKTAEIQNVGSSGADVTLDVTSWLNSDDDKVIGFGIYTATAREQEITNLKLEVTYSSETLYTASFTANSGEITPTVSIYSNEGRTTPVINGTLADKTTYYYRATLAGYNDYEGSFVVNGANPSISFTMTARTSYTCTVNAKAGELLLATNNQSVYSGDNVTVYYQMAYSNAGKWYFVDKNSSSPGYGVTFSDVASNQTQDVTTYTLNNDVVYFGEAEDMTCAGSWAADGLYLNWRSNGGAKRMASKTYIYTSTIAPGVYDVTMWARNNRSAGDGTETLPIYLRDGEGNLTDLGVSFPGWARGGYEAAKTATITIPDDGKDYSVVINNNSNYNSNLELDYVYVSTKENVSIGISSAGWATLYTPCALNFSGVEGLKAYTATTDGVSVTLTPVSDVPANTGVVLEGEAGNYNIPVIASSETEKGNLEGNATAATAFDAFDNTTLYILTLIDNNNVQFNPCNSGEIAAGKAFLKVAKTGGAKALSVMFANDPTGIATVNAAEVAQPAKRIVNGQLVIEKNGKRYNAAGAEF